MVGDYARVQWLLDRLEGGHRPEDLKAVLCPPFASSREEQNRFYDSFDEHLGFKESRLRPFEVPPVVEGKKPPAVCRCVTWLCSSCRLVFLLWYIP